MSFNANTTESTSEVSTGLVPLSNDVNIANAKQQYAAALILKIIEEKISTEEYKTIRGKDIEVILNYNIGNNKSLFDEGMEYFNEISKGNTPLTIPEIIKSTDVITGESYVNLPFSTILERLPKTSGGKSKTKTKSKKLKPKNKKTKNNKRRKQIKTRKN